MSPSNLLLHLATLTSVRKQERNLSLPREALGENKSFKAKTASNVYPEDSNPAPKSSTACDSKSVQTGLSREAVAGARPPRPPRPPRFPSHAAGRLVSTRRAAREAWEWRLCGGGAGCVHRHVVTVRPPQEPPPVSPKTFHLVILARVQRAKQPGGWTCFILSFYRQRNEGLKNKGA